MRINEHTAPDKMAFWPRDRIADDLAGFFDDFVVDHLAERAARG